uniref:Uncharacterized protein n=1 Tax=Ralstonia solanacearum TaxID=305 RepID=A0A0S4UZ63_RALSL|nr:protein of unknown function [Ralstonia solanacearum]
MSSLNVALSDSTTWLPYRRRASNSGPALYMSSFTLPSSASHAPMISSAGNCWACVTTVKNRLITKSIMDTLDRPNTKLAFMPLILVRKVSPIQPAPNGQLAQHHAVLSLIGITRLFSIQSRS